MHDSEKPTKPAETENGAEGERKKNTVFGLLRSVDNIFMYFCRHGHVSAALAADIESDRANCVCNNAALPMLLLSSSLFGVRCHGDGLVLLLPFLIARRASAVGTRIADSPLVLAVDSRRTASAKPIARVDSAQRSRAECLAAASSSGGRRKKIDGKAKLGTKSRSVFIKRKYYA